MVLPLKNSDSPGARRGPEAYSRFAASLAGSPFSQKGRGPVRQTTRSMSIYIYIYIHIYIYIDMLVHIYVYVYVYVNVNVNVYVYVYVCIYIYIYTYMYCVCVHVSIYRRICVVYMIFTMHIFYIRRIKRGCLTSGVRPKSDHALLLY